MKNILIILFTLLSVSSFSQIETYPIKAGQYAILNTGSSENITVEYKSPVNGSMSYKNTIAVVDTIMAVESTTNLDTLSSFTRPSGKILGISFPDSAYYRGQTIDITDDSIVYYTKLTNGNNAVFNGAEIVESTVDSTVVFDVTLATNYTNGLFYNFRQVIPSDSISTSGNKIRIAIFGESGGTDLKGVSFGLRSGTTDDFSGVPTRVTFNGEDTVNVAAGVEVWSDWIDYEVTTGNDYMVHMYGDRPNYIYNSSGGIAYRAASGYSTDETLTETVDYGSTATAIRMLSGVKIETVSSDWVAHPSIANVWSILSPQASGDDAYRTTVLIDDDRFLPVANFVDLDSDFDYFVEDSVGSEGDSIYIYSATNPATRIVELSTKYNGIQCGAIYASDTVNSHITIKNIDFRQYGYAGVSVRGDNLTDVESHWLVDNCNFYFNKSDAVFFRYASYNTVQNSTSNYDGNGFYAARYSHYCSFINDTVTNAISYINGGGITDGHGIGVYLSQNALIENNYITVASNGGGGIGLDQADGIIRYNEVYSEKGAAIGSNVVNVGDTLDIYYNKLFGQGTDGNCFGIHTTNGKVNVFNNTSVQTGSNIHASRVYYPDNVELKNNIFYNEGSTTSILNLVYAGTLESDNNVFYNKNDVAYYIIGNNYITLAAWQSASSQDLNSFDTDPLFTTEFTDLTPQTGSDAINNGVDVGLGDSSPNIGAK